MGMEFVPSDEGPRPTLPQPTPGPNFDETLSAAFRQGNSVVSAFQALRSSGSYAPQDGYSAWDEIKDKPQYLPYAHRFAGFHSPGETQELMAKIDAEERDKRILAASGASGFLAAMVAGTLDPTMLLPGRVIVGAMKEGVPLLRGAAEIGTTMAVQSGAQETALQTSQATRTAGESVLNVGSATVLGALLGSAASILSPAEHAGLVTALDRDRAALDAHVAGRPELSPAPPQAAPVPPESEVPAAPAARPSEPVATAPAPEAVPSAEVRPPIAPEDDMAVRLQRAATEGGGLSGYMAQREAMQAEARAAVAQKEAQRRAAAPDVLRDMLEERQRTEAAAQPVARELPPRTAFSENFPTLVMQQGPQSKLRLTEHPDFAAAKDGDIEAASRVVKAAVTDAQVDKIRAQIGDRNPVLVSVHADSDGARNVLPLAYAEELSARLGFDVDDDIVQVGAHRVKHTGAPAAVRISNRTGFEGKVEPGRDYYLVDDMAVQGGTMADLRSHIESNGGNVIGGTALMGSPYSHILGPRAATLDKLRAKFPDLEDWWKEHFGHGFDAITESEAHYLTRFGSADAVRNRVLEETQARDLGAAARASGYWQEGGEGLREIRRLNEDGKTPQEIADLFGVTPGFIRSTMSRESIRSRAGGAQEAGRKGGQATAEQSFWAQNPDLDEKLIALRKEGKSFGEIANELGEDVTRNMIAGRLDRLSKGGSAEARTSVISDWEAGPDGTMVRRSVGAEASGTSALELARGTVTADTATLQPVRTGLGLERVSWDPVQTVLNQPSVEGRRAVADLVEIPTLVQENLRGEPTTTMGAVPLETMGRIISNKTQVKVHDELLRLWGDLRFEGGKVPFAKRAQLAFGLPERGGSEAAPTFEQFKEMVSDAMMNGDVHGTPQIQQAAAFVRREVFEPWAARAEKVFPEFQRQDAENYFPHVWNKNLIEARRPEFVNKLVAKYWTDQTARQQLQVRLQAFSGGLESREATIDKLTDRIAKRNAALADAEKELEGASRANREAYRRAAELREGEFENEGGIAVPVPGKNREKAAELARQQTAIRERLNTAADKVSGIKHEIEDLEHRLQAEHLHVKGIRERIEEDIGRWEGKSANEAKSAIKAREKYEAERQAKAAAEGKAKPTERLRSADADVDLAVKRILKTDQNKSLDDIRAYANETVDRVLGSPDGRLAYDEYHADSGPRLPGGQARGSLAKRTLDVDNDFARGWVEQDIERVARDHLRTFVPDVLLAERFGDVEMSGQMGAIQAEYGRLIDAVGPNEAERVKLHSQRDKTIEIVAALRDRFRGLYNIPSTAAARRLGRISTAVRNANVPLSLGMAAVSSIPDAAGAVFRWGMTAAFRDAWAPFLKSLMTDRELSTEAMRQFRVMGIATDTFTASRHHEISGTMEAYRPGSPVERTLQWGADKFQILNMLGPWTDAVKTISSTVAATELYRAAKASAEGTATPRHLRALGENNIDPRMAKRIAEQYERSGNTIDGVMLPNTEVWTDVAAREHFEGALSREANISVVTPGLDKPLLFSDPVLSTLLQFKSFTAAATTRIMIANLQRADAQTLQGLVASLGLGMVSYKINAISGGQPTSDRPQDWIKEAMSRGNVFGWLEEGNALASKMTRGGVDIYRLIGADKPLSKFAAQSAPEQLMGPTFGKLQAVARATSGAAAREWDASDTKALRRIIPMQNLVYLRGLFNQMEHAGNHALGAQEKVH